MTMLAALLLTTTLAASSDSSDSCIPKSGDIVRFDDLREFVIVSVSDYEKLYSTVTNLKQRLDRANSSESGRVMFHGKKKHTVVDSKSETTEYEDGYVHAEAIPSKGEKSKGREKTLTPWETRRRAMRKRRAEALSKTNEVTTVINR